MEGFFAGESVPVNQKLSDMLLQLHISERTGRGVPKITEVYGKGTYEFRENSIVVSIPFTRVSTENEDAKWLTKEHLADVKWLPADVTLIEKIGEALYETKNSKEHGVI